MFGTSLPHSSLSWEENTEVFRPSDSEMAWSWGDQASLLPEFVLCNVGKLLSNINLDPSGRRGWKTAGHYMNFSNKELEEFDMQVQCGTFSSAGHAMLEQWVRKRGSTIRVLETVLKHMERFDIVKELYESLKAPCMLFLVLIENGNEKVIQHTFQGRPSLRSVLEDALETENLHLHDVKPSLVSMSHINEPARHYQGQEIQLKVHYRRPDRSIKLPIQAEPSTTHKSIVSGITGATSTVPDTPTNTQLKQTFRIQQESQETHCQVELPCSDCTRTSLEVNTRTGYPDTIGGNASEPCEHQDITLVKHRLGPASLSPVDPRNAIRENPTFTHHMDLEYLATGIPGYNPDVSNAAQAEQVLAPYLNESDHFIIWRHQNAFFVTVTYMWERSCKHFQVYRTSRTNEFFMRSQGTRKSTLKELMQHYENNYLKRYDIDDSPTTIGRSISENTPEIPPKGVKLRVPVGSTITLAQPHYSRV